jgi:AraC-like DNA-binding protein
MEANKTSQKGSPAGNPPDGLSRERMASVCGTVVRYLETSKRYLSPDFCLWELAREVGISARVVSVSINRYMGRNFYEFINRIRIEEAKRLLREAADGDAKVNIAETGSKSGFSSRSIFFARFRDCEGMTPGKWMNIHRGGDTDRENLKQKVIIQHK